MRIKLMGLAFSLLFQTPSQPSAQQSSIVSQRDPQAIAVLTQAIAAAGGSSVIGSVNDFVASGAINYFEDGTEATGAVTVRGKGVSQFRLDALLPSGQRSLIVNNSNGTVSGSKQANGASTPIPYHNAVGFGSLTFPLVHVLAALKDAGTNIRYLGLVTTDGRTLHQISLEPFATEGDPGNIVSKLNSKQLFIDATTLQIMRVSNLMHPDANSTIDFPHEITFSDYRIIDGLLLPFSVTETMGGNPTWTIQFTQIVLNGGLSDAAFQL